MICIYIYINSIYTSNVIHNIYVAGTFGVYFVPPRTNVIKRHSICIYTIYTSKYVYMCVQVQQKVAIFSLAPQPAQRPFSAPRDAVTSTRERTPI